MKEKTNEPKKGTRKVKSSPEENLPIPQHEIVVFDEFTVLRAELEQAAKDYSGLVVTNDNFKDCLKARERLRELRYSIQNQQKGNHAKRVEWNKRMLNANDAKAEELIGIIFPVEEVIDSQIKAIEEVKAKEKAEKEAAAQLIIDERIKRVKEFGAVLVDDAGYLLNNVNASSSVYIALDEIKAFSDSIFENVLVQFKALAEEIAAAAEEEKKKDERTNERTKELYKLGFAFNGARYVSPRSTNVFAIDFIQDEPDAGWVSTIKTVNEEIATYETIKAVEELKQKEAAAEQEEIARKNKKKEEELAAQQQEILKQKQQLLDGRTKLRKSSLLALGMFSHENGFTFNGEERFSEVKLENITEVNDDAWEVLLENVTKEIADIKREDEKIREISAHREEVRKQEEEKEKERKQRIADMMRLGFKPIKDSNTLDRFQLHEIPEMEIVSINDFTDWPATVKAIEQKINAYYETKGKELAAQKEALKPENERIQRWIHTFTNDPIDMASLSDRGKTIVTHIFKLNQDFKNAALELIEHE